jgi:predicted Zn-dependent protease
MIELTLALLLVGAPQDDDSDKVRALFDRLVKAMADKEGAAINRCFHIPRMMKEVEDRGFGAGSKEAERKRARAFEAVLPQIAEQSAATGATWDRIRLLQLKVRPDGDAEALCRMTIGGDRSRVRIWLAKDGQEWRIYDLEMQEGNLRLSIIVGSVWAGLGADEKIKKAVLNSFLAMQRAEKELQSGDSEKALKILEKALASEPPPFLKAWLEVMVTQAHIAEGEYEEAIASADRTLALQKDLHLAHLLKAGAYFQLEDYKKCLEAAHEYVKQSGDDADAWEMIGDAHDKLSNRKEAIAAYRKGAAADDEEHSNRMSLGRLLIADGQAAEAAIVLKEASKNAPTDELVFDEAAELLDGAGQFDAVLEMARDYTKRAPDDVEGPRWEGKALRKLKRFDEAEKALLKGLEKNEDDPDLEEELVFTLAQAGKDADAMKRADKVAAEYEDFGRFLRAFVHVTAARAGKALEELRAMLDSSPGLVERVEKEPAFEKLRQEVDLQILIGRAKAAIEFEIQAQEKVEEKDWEGLLKLAKERVAAAPDHAQAHFMQGQALRKLGKFFDAELALKAAISKTKSKTLFREELGRALAAQGKLDEALPLADELIANEEKVEGLYLRAVANAMCKKTDAALKALAEVFEEDPDWHHVVAEDDDLVELRKLPACKALIKKAKAKSEE